MTQLLMRHPLVQLQPPTDGQLSSCFSAALLAFLIPKLHLCVCGGAVEVDRMAG